MAEEGEGVLDREETKTIAEQVGKTPETINRKQDPAVRLGMGENLDEAERLVKEALKYKPDDGYITDSLGWVYFQKGLYEKSLRYLNRAVELVPDDPVILEHLGDVHLKLSDKEKALEYYRRSLDLREKDREPIEEKIRQLTEGNS